MYLVFVELEDGVRYCVVGVRDREGVGEVIEWKDSGVIINGIGVLEIEFLGKIGIDF